MDELTIGQEQLFRRFLIFPTHQTGPLQIDLPRFRPGVASGPTVTLHKVHSEIPHPGVLPLQGGDGSLELPVLGLELVREADQQKPGQHQSSHLQEHSGAISFVKYTIK